MEQTPKYPPPHHQIQDREKMIDLIRNYPLAQLVTADGDEAYVTHIPIIYNESSGKLVAHIDKYNPQVKTLKDGKQATVVFKGPDTYISPGVYRSDQLPTWNYINVHLKGKVKAIESKEALKESLIRMTEFLEQPDHKYVLEPDNPRMERNLDYIKMFEITITHWEGKFKLSQDKKKGDTSNAREQLIKANQQSIEGFLDKVFSL